MKPGFTLKRHHDSRLSRRVRAAVYVVFGLAWGTGILWLVFHYFLMRQGEFGVEPHPLEAWWLRLHGAGAFAVLWLGGLLWGVHARPALVHKRWRSSGIGIFIVLGLLALSGYLLYYASNESLRDWVRLVHWVLGLSLSVPLLIHVLGARAWRRRQKYAKREKVDDL